MNKYLPDYQIYDADLFDSVRLLNLTSVNRTQLVCKYFAKVKVPNQSREELTENGRIRLSHL